MLNDGRGNRVYTGLRDDPFFFDLEGFKTTMHSGALSFDHQRDSAAGTNATAIVLEMDANEATGRSGSVNLWATTSVFGGAP